MSGCERMMAAAVACSAWGMPPQQPQAARSLAPAASRVVAPPNGVEGSTAGEVVVEQEGEEEVGEEQEGEEIGDNDGNNKAITGEGTAAAAAGGWPALPSLLVWRHR